jgi:hypothetical protein
MQPIRMPSHLHLKHYTMKAIRVTMIVLLLCTLRFFAHMDAHNPKARELGFNPKPSTLTFHCLHVNSFLLIFLGQDMELKLEH